MPKHALVTGAGTGIGKAMALALAGEGYRILATGRRLEPLQSLATEIGDACEVATADVGDPDAVRELARRWQVIDLLVNNAGSDVGGRRPFVEGELENWANTIRTNVTGVINLCGAFAPGMVERRRGTIVNISSSVANRSYAGSAVYASSKAAVHMFTDCLRAELHETGVRVLEIQPGLVRTDFDRVRKFGDEGAARDFYEGWGSHLDCADIARAMLFAISQPADVVLSNMTILPRSDW